MSADPSVALACKFVETRDADGNSLFLVVLNRQIRDLGFDDCRTLRKWMPNLKLELVNEFYHPDFIKTILKQVGLIRKEAHESLRKVRRRVAKTLLQLQLHGPLDICDLS